MIKLNLLDENEIARGMQQAGAMGTQTSSVPSAKMPKAFLLAPIVAGVIYLGLLGYYFLEIKGPLGEIQNEYEECEKKISQLTPKVAEAEKSFKERDSLKKYAGEFENFILEKKNWSRILNILSDELPDEIVFASLNVSESNFSKKTKTDKGLLTVSLPCILLRVDLSVPEEFQSKISAYEKKLKSNSWLSQFMLGLETTGLMLNDKCYTSSLKIYFVKIQEKTNE